MVIWAVALSTTDLSARSLSSYINTLWYSEFD